MPSTTPKGVTYSLGGDAIATIDSSMQALAEWVDEHPGVSPLTNTQRDALAGADRWDGRIIWNLTAGRLERWSAGSAEWLPIFRTALTVPDVRNFTLQGEVRVDNAALDFYINPYTVYLPANQTNHIVRLDYVLRSGGTASCALDRITAAGASTRIATFTADTTYRVLTLDTPVALADRDRIALVVTAAASAPKHLTVGVAHSLGV